jgi:thiosulfate/3-mercaptopyruvate sulfurtransferase
MDSLVSTDWLAGELGASDLKVVDASWHLPSTGRDAAAEFDAAHIPGARFLDLAQLADRTSPLPNTLPTNAQFGERMAGLGVTSSDRVVLYDDSAVKTAARAWFVLRLHGFENVAILDGGIGKWRAEGRALESGSDTPQRTEPTEARSDASRVRDKAEMLANIVSGREQVIDARDAGRFSGEIADTVHNLAGGHIPGARNLPFAELFRPDGTFKPEDELRAAFADAGVDVGRPIVTSCGSGITASVLLFALDRLGVKDAALYDGSWTEWGADPATPKEAGAAR